MWDVMAGGTTPVRGSAANFSSTHSAAAWDLSTGDKDVVIAIIDPQGCQLGHPNLQYFSRGENTGTGGDGSPVGPFNEAHGTACAGIAACDN